MIAVPCPPLSRRRLQWAGQQGRGSLRDTRTLLACPGRSGSAGSGRVVRTQRATATAKQCEPGMPREADAKRELLVPLDIPHRRLNTGAVCPGIGYGTGGEGKCTPDELVAAVRSAIDAGYRSFDSAPIYDDGNVEAAVGRAIRESGLPRSDFFITTKIWPTFARNPEKSLQMSLETMKLDYVDCLLVHWPIPLRPVPGEPYAMGDTWDAGWDLKKTWAKMQTLPKSQARAIGVSNFTINRLRLLLDSPTTKVVPAVLQVEGHPELPQKPLMNFCRKHSIQAFCYSPLAKGQVSNDTIRSIADKYGIGSAQVALSWAVQRGTVPLPKSLNADRIKSNIELVYLDEEDFARLDELGRKPRRIVNPRIFFGHDIFENNADSYEHDENHATDPPRKKRAS